MTLIFCLWIFNLVISYWNARVAGQFWDEVGNGFSTTIKWCAVVQSACGFTWCFSIAMLFTGYHVQPVPEVGHDPYITLAQVEAGLSLAYLLVIPGILLSGFVIWAQSVAEAIRRRDFTSMGVAGWNTFAQGSNMINATRDIPSAWGAIGKLFKGDNKTNALIVAMVIFALFGGVFTTYSIVSTHRKAALRKSRIAAAGY